MLEIQNVTKYFGDYLAVDNVSFSAKVGDIIGFLGPNGAGKSTTMRIISGYFVPNNGDVKLDGISVTENPEEFKSKIGYMPENNPLFSDMTIIEHIRFVKSVRKDSIDDKLIAEYIKKFHLEERLGQKISELSKGYRQRVGMLLALVHNPQVLILDEPNEGLDPNQREEIRTLLKELSKNKIIIISTHVLQEVESICNKVVIINKGKIQQEGNIDDLRKLRNNQIVFKIKMSTDKGFKDSFKSHGNIESKEVGNNLSEYTITTHDDKTFIEEFNQSFRKSNWKLHELKSEVLSIGDLFKELTTDEK